MQNSSSSLLENALVSLPFRSMLKTKCSLKKLASTTRRQQAKRDTKSR
jgi:hypothetical protein